MNSDVVFVGKVLKQAELPRPEPEVTIVNGVETTSLFVSTTDPSVYLVKVSEVIRDKYHGSFGSATNAGYVYVRQGGDDCGAPLVVGREMVILAMSRGSKFFETSSCDGTVTIEEGQDFLRRLKRIKSTMDAVDKEERDQRAKEEISAN